MYLKTNVLVNQVVAEFSLQVFHDDDWCGLLWLFQILLWLSKFTVKQRVFRCSGEPAPVSVLALAIGEYKLKQSQILNQPQ